MPSDKFRIKYEFATKEGAEALRTGSFLPGNRSETGRKQAWSSVETSRQQLRIGPPSIPFRFRRPRLSDI